MWKNAATHTLTKYRRRTGLDPKPGRVNSIIHTRPRHPRNREDRWNKGLEDGKRRDIFSLSLVMLYIHSRGAICTNEFFMRFQQTLQSCAFCARWIFTGPGYTHKSKTNSLIISNEETMTSVLY